MTPPIDRRSLLVRAASVVGVGTLAATVVGCDRLVTAPGARPALQVGEDANLFLQRLLLSPGELAPQYTPADLSPAFKANGSVDPTDKRYRAMAKNGFSDYRLEVGGLVETPLKLSLADLRALPSRTQITRHDCVEGWSCIGQWTGVPLSEVLSRARLKPQARYIVFRCADIMEGPGAEEGGEGGDDDQSKPIYFYGTIDLVDAFHPQTILAYEMNNVPLPVAHGAPLRVRVERQLGYKMSKYIMAIDVVEDFAKIGDGHGGYWEDNGYDWYAGI